MDIRDLRLLKTCPNSKCWDDFMEAFNMTYKARSTGLEERFGLCCKIRCWRFHGTVLGWRKVAWQRQYSGQKWLWWVLSDFETDHTQKINLGQSSPIISNPRKACSGHWGVHSLSSWTIHFPNTGLRMVKQVTWSSIFETGWNLPSGGPTVGWLEQHRGYDLEQQQASAWPRRGTYRRCLTKYSEMFSLVKLMRSDVEREKERRGCWIFCRCMLFFTELSPCSMVHHSSSTVFHDA